MIELSITRAFEGRSVLFTGSTGFVGKVALSMLLHRFPNIGRVYPLVRPTLGSTAADRFFGKVATSHVFSPIRERYDAAYEEFLRGKCEPLAGDVTEDDFELDAETIARLTGKIDVIVNVAGIVSFTPPLDNGLRINTLGARNAVRLAKKLGAALVHVSTCFVTGERDGTIWENEPIAPFYPRIEELGDEFSATAEIADCERISKEVRARAEDRQLQSMFRDKARERLRDEGRDERDEKALKLAAARERKMWVNEELTQEGMRRAQHWGWPNTYCYTKSLGDQVIAEEAGSQVRFCIVRPAIVESALRYPCVGWNEGMTTSAPLAFVSLKGHTNYPSGEGTILDMVPVDLVAAGLITATGATLLGENQPVYQLGSSDTNPLTMKRAVELLGLYRRRWYRKRAGGNKWMNALYARLEAIPVSRERWDKTSAPAIRRVAKGVSKWLEENRPRWGAPRVENWIDRAQDRLARVERLTGEMQGLFDLFMPFIYERKFVFRCDNIRALQARLVAEDRAALPWDPETLDWREYWLDIHLEGLQKWVFPSLEEEFKEKPRSVYAYRDLLEMFESAAKRFRNKTAMRVMGEDGESSRYTYGELKRMADVAGGSLIADGVTAGEKILLVSENRPEWSISYFGILKAGAIAVPVDPGLRPDEIANIARSAGATRAIVSEKYADKVEGLRAHSFEGLFAPPVPPEKALVPVHRPDDLASLIYTSGTTGTPKGVMLSHRNFTSLLSKLQSVFEMRKSDGLLSVLPLHHTFEFTAGLLMPLSRGAEVTYIDEITPERLRESMKTGRITALVGVPALWQALARRITTELEDKSPWLERGLRGLAAVNREVRNRNSFVNLGKFMFYPIHKRFGGRIRMMISGGSALNPDIMKLFHGLGFQLLEGYGLTEAAPVLTAMRPGNKLLLGTVGEPLPGIEVKIHEPDANGVGEVIARGPNVMAGYYNNAEATAEVLKDGWLFTGDLGKIEDGRLCIVGRAKDVIIDANGKNVYPDELEDLYGDSPWIKELSVVGLPDDDGGETIAALIVPNYEHDKDMARDDVRAHVHEKLDEVAGTLPFYKRVKVLHLWDGELPRTATRKVKRKVVVDELQRLEKTARAATGAKKAAAGGGDWVLDVVASVAQKPRSQVSIDTRLADLGYDSLMYTELGAALEAAGAAPPEDITGIQTVRDLVKLVGKRQGPPQAAQVLGRKEEEPALEKKLTDIEIPESVQKAGKRFFGFGQRFAYEKVFKTTYHGQVNIPAHGRFLVAANHQSHLDMGLVKMALGDQGKNLVALAAKDYFFDSWRGAYFKNFTNLLPMERHGSMKESLRIAADAVQSGYILLIFPEGTRSTTGVMTDFKPSLGYLALTNKVDILPMYLEGTYDAWPKGQALPEPGAEIAAHIGPVLTYEYLRKRTEGMTKAESYRVASAIAEEAVKAMRDGRKWRPEEAKPVAAGKNGNGEHHEAEPKSVKPRKKPKRPSEIADE